jgi:hypothetical protein
MYNANCSGVYIHNAHVSGICREMIVKYICNMQIVVECVYTMHMAMKYVS